MSSIDNRTTTTASLGSSLEEELVEGFARLGGFQLVSKQTCIDCHQNDVPMVSFECTSDPQCMNCVREYLVQCMKKRGGGIIRMDFNCPFCGGHPLDRPLIIGCLGLDQAQQYRQGHKDKNKFEVIDECPRCKNPAYLSYDEMFLGQCGICQSLFCTNCRETFHGMSECIPNVSSGLNGSLSENPLLQNEAVGATAMPSYPRDIPSFLLEINCPKCSELAVMNEECHLFFGECIDCDFIFCTNCNKEFHGYKDCNAEETASESPTHPQPRPLPRTTFECQICLTDESLDNTADLECGHLYCKTCVKGYYETLIKDGRVNNLKCPFETCNINVTPVVLQKLIDPDVYTIMDSKLLDEALQDIPEIVCCPQLGCGRRFQSLPECGYCESCNYYFCTNCMQTYHGLTICGETEEQRLNNIKQFIAAANEEEAARLEEIERAKRKAQDEQSNGCIKQLCKKCPHCRANIEKSEGCHHMTCSQCSTHFCWICLTILDQRDIYSHFRGNRTGCDLFDVPS